MAPSSGGVVGEVAAFEMAAAADAAARQARARYQSSLEALRQALATFPSIKKELGAHEARLDELEHRVAGLRNEIAEFASSTRAPNKEKAAAALPQAAPVVEEPPSTLTRSKSAVSFTSDERLAEVHCYDLADFDEHMPEHGHWLPSAITDRRASFEQATDFAKRLNGRMVTFTTGSDEEPNNCVLVEPMGKILSPHEYVSTGVVLCVLGAESAQDAAQEWGLVLKQTRWLDAGLSVALPDLQPGCGMERENLEAAVQIVLSLVGVSRCLLVGKGWGAELALEVAASGRLGAELAGVMLVAPGSLVESACGRLTTPSLLLWAQDDEVSPHKEARSWAEAMSRWPAPTCLKEADSGGHDLAKVLEGTASLSQALMYFCSTALLIAELQRLAARMQEEEGAVDEVEGEGRLPERAVRLADELPSYLAGLLGSLQSPEQEDSVASALAQQASGPSASRALRRAASRLQDWINCGMQQVASATE